ncbi:hypothetical protein B0H13DRAFT_2321223 [Mycena leptocephala]|nr:hypothetical protein B0H13DRAFT_2321223 [Mycena leptocephala]
MAAPPALPPLDGTLGVIQVGLVLATWLFGIETLQTFNYYREFPKDPIGLKGLVGGIWFLELAHTITGWHAMYSVTVTFYGQPQHIFEPPLTLVLPVLFHGLIALAVQTFFVYRVRVVSGKATVYSVDDDIQLGRDAVSSLGPGVEITVAASLLYYLWNRRGADFSQTNRILDTIIIWTVESTLITTLSGIIQLILFLTRRNDLSWILLFFIQAKLFSNSLLASLNGRTRFRAGNNVVTFNSTGPATNTDVVIRMQQMSDTVYSEDPTRSRKVGKLLTLHCSNLDFGVLKEDF